MTWYYMPWLTPSTSVETDSFRSWLLMHSLDSPSDSGWN